MKHKHRYSLIITTLRNFFNVNIERSFVGLAFVLAIVFNDVAYSQIISWDFTSGNTPNINLPGGTTALSFNTGGTTGTSGCNNNGFSIDNWNVGEYFQIVAPTSGYEITTITFNVRSSGTGPGNFKVRYSSTGTSGTFIDLTSGSFTSGNATCVARSFDLSAINQLDNNSNTVIRLVFTGGQASGSPATGDAAGGGTFRIDDLIINGTALPCSGIPTPGNTVAAPTSVTSGNSTTLSLQNITSGSGVSYQWYSSTSSASGPWSAIGSATSANYTATPTSLNTWYFCTVTCSGSTGSSSPVLVTMTYCTPTFPSNTEPICNVTFNTINNNSTCSVGGSAYTNYSNISTTVSRGISYPISVSGNTNGAYTDYIAVYIDFNQNGIYTDAGETFQIGTIYDCANCSVTGNIAIPLTSLTGTTTMRIVKRYNQYGPSCNSAGFGEAEDYSLIINDPCTAPTTQASNVNFTTSSATTGTVTWTSGNGNGAIVVVRATSTSAVLPSNGTVYSANTAFGSGTGSAITGTGNYVVFAGSGNTVSISGLTANTAYTATVYEYNTTAQCYNLTGASAAATTPCAPYTGTYSVGSGTVSGEAGHYATLTAAVADYNTRCITGPLVFLLTDATYSTGTGETFPITINSNSYASAVNTLTIKPNTGVSSTITANSTSATILLNGADYVTIDGSNGTTTNSLCPKVQATRNLTIRNTNTNTANNAVVWLQSSGTDGPSNNTIKNCIITGNSSSTTVFGIGSADNTLQFYDTNGGYNSNNNTIENNAVSLVQYGIYSVGKSTAIPNTGTVIRLNDVTSCGQAGIFSGFENGTIISGNFLNNITPASSSSSIVGIGVGLAFASSTDYTSISEGVNYTISYNTIGNVYVTNSYSANGIVIGSSSSGTHTIQNNFIYGVYSNGTLSDYASGIHIGGGAAQYNVNHNTISMQGTITGSTSGSSVSTCIAVTNSTYKLNLRNNILSNTQKGNSGASTKFTCIALSSSTYTNLVSNYNDLYCAGSGPGSYQIGITGSITSGTSRTALINWQTPTGQDANSVNVAPVFTSTTDLHLQAVAGNSSLDNSATNLSVSTDIDCETRSSTPDIGADEFSVTACTGTPNAGTASITTASGCSSTSFTVSATGLSTGSGISYQWQSSSTGLTGSWTNITGANSASYTTSVSSTTYYQLVTTCSNGGGTNTTNVVSFTIVGNPCTCLTYPAIYANNTADNDLTSVTVGSMTNTSNCGDLAPGAGSIAFRYSNYTGSVAGPSAAQGTSVSFSLTENLCAGGSTNQNNFLIYIDWNQDGDFADANEKMFSQIDSGPSTGLVNTQTVTGSFVVPMTALTGVTRMRVINTGGSFPSYNYAQTDFYTQGETEDYCFTVTSASGPVCPSSASISPSSTQTICQNGASSQLSASYSSTGATGSPTIQYQWYYNTTNSNTVSGATLITGQTSSTFTPPSTTVGTRYYFCVVYALDNGCAQTNANQSLASNAVQVTIVDPASVTATITQGATASFCSGSSVTLNANTGSGLTYQWQMNGSPIGGANSSTYPASAAGTYSVVVTGSGGCSATSLGTIVSSNPTPTITAQTSTICSGQAFSVSPASAPSGTTYTWSAPTLNPASSITGGTAQASPQASISQTLTNTTTASATATYTVTPTAGTCVGSTFTVTVTVDPPLNYGTAASVPGGSGVNHLVISQVYGAGGLNGATYNYDYVELFNPTNSTVSINGWSLQYASYNGPTAGGTWSNKVDLSGSIPAGGYYLISLATSNSFNGTAIPTADNNTGTFQMAQSDGKVALVNNTTLLSGYCPTTSNIIDFVGFGLADCFEGIDGTPAISKTTAAVRNNHGCEDTNDNLTNFSATTPNPRNSASPANLCAVAAPTTFCGSGTPGSMSVTGVSGGTSYSYQWYSQTGIVSCPTGNSTTGWTSLGSTNGANTATYTPTSAITTSTTYACLVTVNGSSCGTSQWASSCVQITINPAPSISSYTATYCGGVNFDVTPQNGTNGTVPSNTTYTWAAPSVAGITGATAGAAATSITGNLVNTTDLPINVVYTVTPTTASCTGSVFTVTITVNPSPVVTQMSTSVCSGNSLTVTPTNGSNGVIPTGTVYTWNAPNQSGVTGGLSGTGTAIPTSLTGNGNVVYTITPSLSGGCTGANFLLTVAVDVCQSLGDCNVIVYRVGNGSTLLTDSAQQVSLVEFSPNGSLVQSVAGNFTGSTFLSQTATATSHGFLNSYNGFTAIPGYTSSYNTDNLASLNTKATYILSSNLTGSRVLNTSTSPVPFNGSSYRSSIPVSATTFYCSGTGTSASTGGVWYYNGTSYVQIYGSSSPTFNIRNIEIYNGQLYISTGAGSARGVYAVGTGLPTTYGQTITLQLSNDQATSSPYGFYISPDGCTAYIAEDGNVGGSTIFGIYKWSKINNVWTYQYRYPCYARGLTVDFSEANPKLYVTTAASVTASSSSIIQLTDNGTTFTQNWQQNAGTNYVFLGVDFTPNSTSATISNTNNVSAQSFTACQNGTSQTLTVAAATSSSALTYQWYSNSTNDLSGATAISGATSATYTPPVSSIGTTYYYVKISSNCASTNYSSIASVIVNPNPTATITPSTLCQGSTATLTASGGGTYLWSNGLGTNASVSVSSAGTYSVTVTDSNNCTNTASVTVTTSSPPTIFGISPP